ncbi:glycosyltransferase family 2 protein [Microvirga roseola]|uniref:glycosyltransferase family 2 protein n=1 Tax=Microvirga roseola TaxID=2883126 RepID=UPI001E47FF1C|nr:glycosyltransferase [Microvirga roseola]
MIEAALDFLWALEPAAYVSVFWFFFIFDLPRYTLSTLAVGFLCAFPRSLPKPDPHLPVSILLVGHNESDGLVRSVMSLREQTMLNLQIVVVDDGSSDGMAEVATNLRRRGLIDIVVSTGLRGGKAAGLNLGLQYCRHDLMVVADIDSSFDRDAVEHLVAPLLADPSVGAAAGNLGVRNTSASLLTRFQAIEYYNNISLGRQFTAMFGLLMIVSGAFGGYRRAAIRSVGGWDVGPGDDSNLTTKLRRSGWRIAFAPQAWALTDVPVAHGPLWRQRLRWNRSLVRNRLRKFRSVFNPFWAQFSLSDVIGTVNLLWFHIFLTFGFVIYIVHSFVKFGPMALLILIAVHIIATICELIEFVVAWIFVGRPSMWRLLLYIPGHGLYMGYYMRLNRLIAYVSELMHRRSYRDPFYPSKVRDAQEQF